MQRGWILAILITAAVTGGCAWAPEQSTDASERDGSWSSRGQGGKGVEIVPGDAAATPAQAQFHAARPVPAGNAQPNTGAAE